MSLRKPQHDQGVLRIPSLLANGSVVIIEHVWGVWLFPGRVA